MNKHTKISIENKHDFFTGRSKRGWSYIIPFDNLIEINLIGQVVTITYEESEYTGLVTRQDYDHINDSTEFKIEHVERIPESMKTFKNISLNI